MTFLKQVKRVIEAFLKNIFKEQIKRKLQLHREATCIISLIEMLITHRTFKWLINLEYLRVHNA